MTTYYVSSIIGSDSNAGTSSSAPLATLQDAANLVKPGDTVLVMNGTYTSPGGGTDVLDITTSGTASAPITFEAAPGQNPVIDSSGAWNAVNIQASYIVFSGFTVVGDAANYTLQTALAGYSTGNPSLDGNGIVVNPSGSVPLPNHITIENNTVYNEPGGGIGTEGADYVQILNNVVYDNAHWSAFGNSGISVSTSANLDNNAGVHITISGNLVFGNAQLVPTDGAGAITDGEGIILDTNPGYTGQILVQNNTVYSNGSSGIESFDTANAVINGNTVYGNDTQNVMPAAYAQILINQSNNNTVTNNVTTPPNGTPPAAPVISGDTVNSGSNSVTLTGTAQAFSTITVFDNSTKLGTALTNSSGAWTFTTAPLANGSQSFTATATDSVGQVSPLSSPLPVTLNLPVNLVANGNFATGDFTSWTLGGNYTSGQIVIDNTATGGSTYAAAMGSMNSDGTLSQTIATTPGQTYTLSFWLKNEGSGGNDFAAKWNGQSLLSFTNATQFGYTQYTYTVTATGSTSTLQFSAANGPSQWDLDNISLTTSGTTSGAPVISAIAETPSSGDLNAGKTVAYTITMSEAVTVNTTGGSPTLTLNDGGIATYTGGSGSNALTFSYTVLAGQNTPDLMASAFNLNGATIKDSGGNVANLSLTGVSQGSPQIDTTAPTVSSVVASGTGITAGAGDLGAGKVVTLTVNLSEAVTVAGGTPTLTLNDGGTAAYTGGSGTNALTFSYTVGAGQNTADLAVTAVNLSTATVTDGAGNAANLAGAVTNPAGTLQIDTTAPTVSSVVASGTGITAGAGDRGTGSVVTLTVNLSSAVTVAGGTPTLALNDGGTATYTGGSGSNALTFSYTVAAGQNTADLAVTAVSLGSATVKDGAGNAADLTGAVTNPAGILQIDSTAPTVSSVVASGSGITAGAGDLGVGSAVTLTVNLSEAVTVAGGTPTLTLNDGGTASYTGGSGSNALTFSYTVGAGQNTADLAVTAVNLGTATVKDGAGNAANLAGAATNPAGTLQIDTSAPVISAISETPSSGSLNAGKTVSYTITMSEAVTVNTTGGSPTLMLNDGGTGTYVSGSGTNALTFSYTVLAGQNTPDLMVSAVNLNGATILDGAGNASNLSLTGVSQGSPQIDTTPPTVSSVTATAGTYNAGNALTLTLNMSEAVNVTGTPTLTLNDGGTATYAGGSGSSALTYSYTVASGQDTAGLAVTAVNGTIADLAGNALSTANLPETFAGVVIDTTTPSVLPTVASVVASGTGITAGAGDLAAGGVVMLTVNLNEAVTVAGGTPTVTLNDGGTATYTAGSGTNALTFKYTVAAGQNTADLTVTAVNLNGASVKDGAGNAVDFSGAITNPAGVLQIDTTAPTVAQVVASPSSGEVTTSHTVFITLNTSESTIVLGKPTLLLNDGGTATYDATRSSATALIFDYTVGSRQVTTDLKVSGIVLPTGSSIRDLAGNGAVLTGAGADLRLKINTAKTGVAGASGGNLAVANGAELELFGASNANVTFQSGTGELKLDDSLAFTGHISGLTAADALDLSDVSYGVNTRASFSGNTKGGTLTVTDGSHTAKIALLGNYLSSGWTLSSDGNGGTVVVDPPLFPSISGSDGNANGVADIFTQRLALLVSHMASNLASSGVGESGLSMAGHLDSVSHANSFLAQPVQQHFQHA